MKWGALRYWMWCEDKYREWEQNKIVIFCQHFALSDIPTGWDGRGGFYVLGIGRGEVACEVWGTDLGLACQLFSSRNRGLVEVGRERFPVLPRPRVIPTIQTKTSYLRWTLETLITVKCWRIKRRYFNLVLGSKEPGLAILLSPTSVLLSHNNPCPSCLHPAETMLCCHNVPHFPTHNFKCYEKILEKVTQQWQGMCRGRADEDNDAIINTLWPILYPRGRQVVTRR